MLKIVIFCVVFLGESNLSVLSITIIFGMSLSPEGASTAFIPPYPSVVIMSDGYKCQAQQKLKMMFPLFYFFLSGLGASDIFHSDGFLSFFFKKEEK